MSDRDWEVLIGHLVIYRKGWRWTVLWRSGSEQVPGFTFRSLIDMNHDR